MKFYPESVEEFMHELSIAQNIVKIVNQEYEKGEYSEKVKFVYFSAGKMNAIIPESLQLNFNIVKLKYKELADSTLVIEEKAVIIQCQNCEVEVEINEPDFSCQNCGSTDIKIVQGKDMFVDSFEV